MEVRLCVNGVVLSTLLGGSEQMGDHTAKRFKARGDTCGREAGFIIFHRRGDGSLVC